MGRVVPTEESLDLLLESTSPQRRKGAKQIRRNADYYSPNAAVAAALREALASEVHDRRTWETQYHMIMALGATGTPEDAVFLRGLYPEPRSESMLHCAVGDALVRATRSSEQDVHPLLWVLDQVEYELMDEGALRATALLKLTPEDPGIERIVERGRKLLHNPARPQDLLGSWALVASAGWLQNPSAKAFVSEHLNDPRDAIRAVAAAAAVGKFDYRSVGLL